MNLSTKDYIHNYLKAKKYNNPGIVAKLDIIMKNFSDERKRSRLDKYWHSFIKNSLFGLFESVVNHQFNLKLTKGV